MTPLGWVFLSVSWAVLTYWTIWCLVKIWHAPFVPEEDEHDQRDGPSQPAVPCKEDGGERHPRRLE